MWHFSTSQSFMTQVSVQYGVRHTHTHCSPHVKVSLVKILKPKLLLTAVIKHADFGISGWLFCLLSHSSLMKWWSALRLYRLAHAQRCCHLREPQQSWGFYIISDIVQQMCWWCGDHNFLFVFYVSPCVFMGFAESLQFGLFISCVPVFLPSLLLLPCICLISPLATLSIGCLDLSRVQNITSSQFLQQGSWLCPVCSCIRGHLSCIWVCCCLSRSSIWQCFIHVWVGIVARNTRLLLHRLTPHHKGRETMDNFYFHLHCLLYLLFILYIIYNTVYFIFYFIFNPVLKVRVFNFSLMYVLYFVCYWILEFPLG